MKFFHTGCQIFRFLALNWDWTYFRKRYKLSAGSLPFIAAPPKFKSVITFPVRAFAEIKKKL
ncbi:hypothetical protein AAW12_24240 [Sphingobacterium sp. Ag1]|nr:hypothetical protein AAW12_24240 [Sphingobacterium sp. Ag1]